MGKSSSRIIFSLANQAAVVNRLSEFRVQLDCSIEIRQRFFKLPFIIFRELIFCRYETT